MSDDLSYSFFKLFSICGGGFKRIYELCAKARLKKMDIGQVFQLTETNFDKLFPVRYKDLYLAWHDADDTNLRANFEKISSAGIEIIHPFHEFFPKKLLLLLKNPPLVFFCQGALRLLNAPSIAVIGARDASEAGLFYSEKIAYSLAKKGWNIVSGYARGVDLTAHFGALQAGGTTIFVLSYGIEHFARIEILEGFDLLKNSLILSQFPPESEWQNSFGVIRNLTIIGLSSAVIVIEADAEGGTMFTATRALEHRIPVYTLAPSLFKSSPEGNKILLKNKAIAVNSIEEMLNILPQYPKDN
jgi:DNA processing protein